jgi:malate dehydrogenase (oxaloacetate-decarboxylating)
VFRGLLDAHAREITDGMLMAASTAIADVVAPDTVNASFIIPSVFDAAVVPAVAEAVRTAAVGKLSAAEAVRTAAVGKLSAAEVVDR